MTQLDVELRQVFCVHRTGEGDAAALQGTQLELARGEVLCVLGPSGAGKSTLLRVIAGFQVPSAGMVSVLGCDLARMSPHALARFRHRHLGFMEQHAETALAPDLRADQAIGLPLALRGAPKRARAARVAELLHATELSDRADALPEELSGGERQRLALCVALAHRPAMLLADEPTGELDQASAEAVRGLIAELARQQGTSVVIVSHDAATASMADRAVLLRDGRVVEERRYGRRALVVDLDGWLRVPSGLRREAGISTRVRVQASHNGLLLTSAAPGSELSDERGTETVTPNHWRPARVALHDVTRSYRQGTTRRSVIDSLTETFAPSCLTVVTGRSGTGKTTLLRLLAGLDRPDSGQLTLDAVSLDDADAEQLARLRRRRIGFLPQQPCPVGFLSALENVVLVLRIRGWEPGAATERARAALARVGLADRADQRVHRLSAGEAQRVALARALASARGLLIVDEPTSRLDAANAATVGRLLSAAAREDGQTVICATHDPALIDHAERLIALDGGSRSAAGRP
jgi:peptide/nickel transport system ATP-binding protein